VSTDLIHIVCSMNCVHCTITNHNETQSTHDNDDDDDGDYGISQKESLSVCEPYTSDNLSRLRSGYKLLSKPSSAVKFNFNSQQVSDIPSVLSVDLT